MKREIRILGIDDAPFNKFNRGEQVLVIGTVFRGGSSMDGLLSTTITMDGSDSTRKIIAMVNKSRNKDQLSVIMIDGVALGGLNIVDINEVSRKTNLPVLTVIRKMPDMSRMKRALKKVKNSDSKLELLEKAGEIYSYGPENKALGLRRGKIYFQTAGIKSEEAEKVLKLTVIHGLIPEPIRIAHIIGSGIKKGESKGRA